MKAEPFVWLARVSWTAVAALFAAFGIHQCLSGMVANGIGITGMAVSLWSFGFGSTLRKGTAKPSRTIRATLFALVVAPAAIGLWYWLAHR